MADDELSNDVRAALAAENAIARTGDIRSFGEAETLKLRGNPKAAPQKEGGFRGQKYQEADENRVAELRSNGDLNFEGRFSPISRNTEETIQRDSVTEVSEHGIPREELTDFTPETLVDVDFALDRGIIKPEDAIKTAQQVEKLGKDSSKPEDVSLALHEATAPLLNAQDGQQWQAIEADQYASFPEGATYLIVKDGEQLKNISEAFGSSGHTSMEATIEGESTVLIPNEELNEMTAGDFSEVNLFAGKVAEEIAAQSSPDTEVGNTRNNNNTPSLNDTETPSP